MPATYVLGHSSPELERLTIQARLIDPVTRRFLADGGIGPGMRVLDVGSGAGDVAFLAAELVGDAGEVVGVDRSAAALAVARERAASRALHQVSFIEGEPAAMSFARPFDAVIGRYVLMFQPEPAALLHRLAAQVHPAGAVVFHEPDRDGLRSWPPVPLYERCCKLVDETLRRSGADPRMGVKLHAAYLAAGLPAPRMRLESLVGGGADSADQVHFEMDLAVSLSGEMERLGVATREELRPESLFERVFAEVRRAGSVIVTRSEIGAWCRK